MRDLILKVRDKYLEDLQKTYVFGDKYHLEKDTWSHIVAVYTLVEAMYHQVDKNKFLATALLHDIGKPLAKTILEDGRVVYRGHENVSTVLAFEYIPDLKRLTNQWLDVIYLINYHGVTWQKSKKQLEKYFAGNEKILKDIFTFRMFDQLGQINPENIWKQEVNFEDLKLERTIIDDKDKVIHMMIGLPNSGKSTYIKENFNLPVLSRDEIVMELGNGLSYNEAWEKVNQNEVNKIFDQRKKEFKKYNEFVLDLTNLSWKSRKQWFNYYKDYNFKLYVFLIPYDMIIDRNNKREGKHIPEKVIIDMMKRFELPLWEEGNIAEITFIEVD